MNHWQNFYHDATAEELDHMALMTFLFKKSTL